MRGVKKGEIEKAGGKGLIGFYSKPVEGFMWRKGCFAAGGL